MKRLVPLLLTLFLVCACAPAYQANSENIQLLKNGMTKAEVNRAMDGEDHDSDAFETSVVLLEFWLYKTGYDHAKNEYKYTPVVFENGRVIGWGNDFFDQHIHMGDQYKKRLHIDE